MPIEVDVVAAIAAVVRCVPNTPIKRALAIARSNAFVALALEASGHLQRKRGIYLRE